jgi:GNAT superfamily N-acetyltransferase
MFIGKAVKADIPKLCGLLDELFSMEEEFCPEYKKQKTALEMILDNPHYGVIIVARDEQGESVGMVSLLYNVSTAFGGLAATLEDMIVSENYRGRGVGAELISAALKIALSDGIKRITLLTDDSNLSAQRFYKKQGFDESEMIVMRSLM